jgi:AcrR family transcriptional regulator
MMSTMTEQPATAATTLAEASDAAPFATSTSTPTAPNATSAAAGAANANASVATPSAATLSAATPSAATPSAATSSGADVNAGNPDGPHPAEGRRPARVRPRVRAEMVDEITRVAREHLATHGAQNLSLRAVARELGLVSSAVYRYFESRDELLTALIIDAHNSIGEAAEQAVAAVDQSDLVERHRTWCRSVRTWALAHPHEYALTYGSPVPGYAAPQDTVGPASRVPLVLLRILDDGVGAGIVRPHAADWLPAPVATDMHRIASSAGVTIVPTVMARGMIAWTELFGTVSFEVFGRLDATIQARDEWFEHQIHAMARLIGLRP